MYRIRAMLFAAVSVVGATPALAASQGDTQSMALAAQVLPFCKISQDQHVASVDGSFANLGTVTEVCNARSGYRVEVRLTNVLGGTVRTAHENASIVDGSAVLVRDSARKLAQNWTVQNLVRRNAAAAVTVHFTVSPI